MTRDPQVLEQSHQAAAEQIEGYLKEGKSVAFLTLGDPAIYSTYIYVHKKCSRTVSLWRWFRGYRLFVRLRQN